MKRTPLDRPLTTAITARLEMYVRVAVNKTADSGTKKKGIWPFVRRAFNFFGFWRGLFCSITVDFFDESDFLVLTNHTRLYVSYFSSSFLLYSFLPLICNDFFLINSLSVSKVVVLYANFLPVVGSFSNFVHLFYFVFWLFVGFLLH